MRQSIIASLLTLPLILLVSGFSKPTSNISGGWVLDPEHSEIGFTATHLLISEVDGEFHDYKLSMNVTEEDFSDARISMEINTASIDTESKERDEHLRSQDFFDVGKYPVITFESTSFRWVANKTYKMKGWLTIKGVRHLETFDVKYGGKIIDPVDGLEKAGFKVEGVINRYDYDLKWNIATAAESFAVGEDIEIECTIRLNRRPLAASN